MGGFITRQLDHIGAFKTYLGISAQMTRYMQIIGGFPGGSDGKESACNAEDLGLIPGSGRSPGEENGKPTPVFLPGECHGCSLGGLQFTESQRIGHDLATNTFPFSLS